MIIIIIPNNVPVLPLSFKMSLSPLIANINIFNTKAFINIAKGMPVAELPTVPTATST
tara:strand:- start:753 stop:926 length:174 start_codon:yes stop_codon:yes gene_type:complete